MSNFLLSRKQVGTLVAFVLASRGVEPDNAELTHADVENWLHAGGEVSAYGPDTKVKVVIPQADESTLYGLVKGAYVEPGNVSYSVAINNGEGDHTCIGEIPAICVSAIEQG